ncbi:MAG: 3-phosphoshikimate 1-carboxyvinyltransferase [Chlamydiota bacterium]
MNTYALNSQTLKGEITIPASKSHTLRAILFGSLGHGRSVIHHYLPSTDTNAMIEACRLFGATINVFENHLEIDGVNGKIEHAENVIDAGNSGIVLRFCAAVGALSSRPIVITGDHSIRHQRSMQPLLDGLAQLGVSTKTMREDGYAPVIIQGPLVPGKAYILGEDSQYVSALLIASCFADGTTELIVQNPGEKPWIALTLDWLDRLNIPYENDNFEKYRIFGNARYEGFTYTVPGDFSSAAFPIAAALVTSSELYIKNINMSDSQGDKELIHVLQKMGAFIEIDEENKALHVKKGGVLRGMSIDINNFVDAITILSVVACFAEGTTHIYNGSIAKQKECNRIASITQELRKMNANIKETEDGLIIEKSVLQGADVFSHHDHRMVMSLTVAALGAIGETRISSTACVAKTFPSFVIDFNALGAKIEVIS